MYKSPLGPPFSPGSPSPLNTTVWLSSIPAGIFTLILACFLTVPFPLQLSQGSFITSPVPWQFVHVLVVCIWPSIVFWTCLTVPVPLHTEHFDTVVPGFAPVPLHIEHVSGLVTSISFSTPKNASSNVISIFKFKSAPLRGPLDCALEELVLAPPPKNDENMSPKSPKSENPSNPFEELYE